MSEQELLPCPMCGSKASLRDDGDGAYGEKYWVNCEGQACTISTSTYSDPYFPITEWNTRTQPSSKATDEQVECERCKARLNEINMLNRKLDDTCESVAALSVENERLKQSTQPIPAPLAINTNCAVAAIKYAINDSECRTFLQCWIEGNFDALRREWSDIPDAVFPAPPTREGVKS